MSDVFISYASADRQKAKAIRNLLEAEGWDVWWDRSIDAGTQWAGAIQDELPGASCMVVLWSQSSVASRYVRAEARRREQMGGLLPLRLDPVELPLPFGEYQTIDLTTWAGEPDADVLGTISKEVARILEPATSDALEAAAETSFDRVDSPILRTAAAGGSATLTDLAALFSLEVRSMPKSSQDAGPEDLYETAIQAVGVRGKKRALRINGPAGTGIEELLACLFQHQLARFAENPANELYPIWIDLRDYDRPPAPESRLTRYLSQVHRFVDEHRAVKPLVFLAGVAGYTDHRATLQRLAADSTQPFRRVIGIERGVAANEFLRTSKGSIPGSDQNAITLCSLNAGSPEAARATGHFARLVGVAESDLVAIMGRCHFGRVDVRTLAAALVMLNYDPEDFAHSADYIAHYLTDDVLPSAGRELPTLGEDPNDSLRRAAQYAYDFVVQGKTPPLAIQRSAEWQIVHTAPDLTDYLVAHRVAQSALEDDPTPEDQAVLCQTYTHEQTRFARDVINASKRSKARFVERAEAFLETPDRETVATVSFLLGRLEGIDAQNRARRLLRRTRDRFVEQLSEADAAGASEDEISGLLFSLRSIFVSLIYLGDEGASADYIRWLLQDRRWNRINRVFHLEYYGDLPLMPADAHRTDVSPAPFPRTRERLTEKISQSLDGAPTPHFDLDTFTLFSLAQHEHAAGRLSREAAEQLVDLGRRVSGNVASRDLARYLDMVMRHLGRSPFGTGAIVKDLYRIKTTKRTGWVNRKVRRPESVADHMYGAFLLAFSYLPVTRPETGYDRDRILKLLLIHDLAESETGDIVNKTRAEDEAESRWFAEAAMLSTYQELAGIGELGELWDEFQGQSTINAKIAKDFDRLDQLAQLYLYRDQVVDFPTWRQEIRERITTSPGRKALESLMSYFDN